MEHMFLKIFPFNIRAFFETYCNISLFIPDSVHLNPLFILVSWTNGLLILLIFSKSRY